jgi:hypothetical protein
MAVWLSTAPRGRVGVVECGDDTGGQAERLHAANKDRPTESRQPQAVSSHARRGDRTSEGAATGLAVAEPERGAMFHASRCHSQPRPWPVDRAARCPSAARMSALAGLTGMRTAQRVDDESRRPSVATRSVAGRAHPETAAYARTLPWGLLGATLRATRNGLGDMQQGSLHAGC